MKARIEYYVEKREINLIEVPEAFPDVTIQADLITITLTETQAAMLSAGLAEMVKQWHIKREKWVKDSSNPGRGRHF
jgi:hypothetical protein